MADLPDVYLKFDGNDEDGHPLKGESMDETHKGDDGWITIRQFNFSFGTKGKEGASGSKDAATGGKKSLADVQKELADTKAKMAAMQKSKAAEKSWGHSGPLDFAKIKFSKSSDFMSDRLMDLCHDSVPIKEVTVVACRRGGSDSNNKKMEFLRLIFSNVYLTSCKLNLATEGLPSEDIEFEYDIVKMECLWTDNATGARLTSQPIKAGWDLDKQEPAA